MLNKISKCKFLLAVVCIVLITILVSKFPGSDNSLAAPDEYSISRLRTIPFKEVQGALRLSKELPYEKFYRGDTSNNLPRQLPIDWGWQAKTNRSLNFNLHAWDMIDQDLEAFSIDRDKKHLGVAVNIAIDWISQNRPEKKNSEVGTFAWYDMAVGVRAYRLAFILDEAIKNEVGNLETQSRLWQSLLDHLAYLKDEKNIVYKNNHGLFEAAGQLAAARRTMAVNPMIKSIKAQAEGRLQRMIRTQFTTEGVHKEHSPGYHYGVYTALLRLKESGLIENNATLRSLSDAGHVLYWMTKPNGQLVEFGDTAAGTTLNDSVLNKETRSRYLEHIVSNSKRGSLPKQLLKAYPKSGLAVIKTRDSYLAQQLAFHSRYHKHADDLTISWYDKGQDILIDSGKYAYLGRTTHGSKAYKEGFWYADPKRQYVETTRAHNTVEIDGKDFLRMGRRPFGSALTKWGKIGEDVFYISSRVREFNTIEYNRVVVFKPGNWLLVSDEIGDTQNQIHDFTQWFHFAGNLRIKNTYDGLFTEVSSEKLRIINLNPGVEPRVISGQDVPTKQGWYAYKTNELKPNDTLGFSVRNKRHTYITTMFTFDKMTTPQAKLQFSKKLRISWKNGEKICNVHINYQSMRATID